MCVYCVCVYEPFKYGFNGSIIALQCSKEDVGLKLRRKIEDVPAVHISNPKTLEFQVGLWRDLFCGLYRDNVKCSLSSTNVISVCNC